MKKKNDTRFNMRITMYIIIALFVILAAYFIVTFASNGESWFSSPYNPRINAAKSAVEAGTIYDRNGVVLAGSDGTERYYHDDKKTRRAVSHVVGDSAGVSLGAETIYSRYLYGFDTGVIDRISSAMSGDGNARGTDITLTVDSALSRYIYTEMDYHGSAVVMNYKTGEVLASVSIPTFDPANMEDEDMETGTQFVDRSTMGRYAPGSTMKVLTAAAAVEQGTDFTYTCTGEEIIDGQRITCVKEHGTQNLELAFENSCNTYFAVLSQKIGIGSVRKWAEKALYNHDFELSDIYLYSSQFETSDSAGDNAWAAIGQYNDLVTPMHNCMIAACIANDGKMPEPHMLKSVSGSSYVMQENTLATLDAEVCSVIKEFMRDTVESGTATNAQISGYSVCGKTGTAEYTEDGEVKNHSWFIGFIDDDSHPLAVSVILEGAGYGSKYATPLAKKALERALELGY